MFVPHGDDMYYGERPRIAVPATDVIDLDGYFGLHPRLAALKPWWDAKSLAAIHAIGSPDASRSHFDAQDYMEAGTPRVKAPPHRRPHPYRPHEPPPARHPVPALPLRPPFPR